jgi:hypothetical protein
MKNNSEQSANQQAPIGQQPINQIVHSGSKFNTILLVIILLIVVGVGAYLLGTSKVKTEPITQVPVVTSVSQAPDPTVNWKTYISNKYGLSVKYPSVFAENPILSNLTYGGINLANLSNGEANSLKINYYSSLENYRLKDNPGGFLFYFDMKSKQWMHDDTNETSEYAPKKVNSAIESYLYSTSDVKCGWKYILIPTPNYKSIIELINGKCSDDDGSNLPGYINLTSGEILSGFKFIGQNPTTETSGWKTYVNSQYGYEIKYPENFGANVWKPNSWPPSTTVVSINDDPIQKGCPNFPIGSIGNKAVTQEKLKINNISYALHKAGDAAAGSSYNSYCYVTTKDKNYYVIDFVIQTTNGCGHDCATFCGTKYEAECINFSLKNEVEKPIGDIVSTFRFTK